MHTKYAGNNLDDEDFEKKIKIQAREHINQPSHRNRERFDPLFSSALNTERENFEKHSD